MAAIFFIRCFHLYSRLSAHQLIWTRIQGYEGFVRGLIAVDHYQLLVDPSPVLREFFGATH